MQRLCGAMRFVVGWLGMCSMVAAAQEAPTSIKPTGYDQLAELGTAVVDLDGLKDNVFLYERRSGELQRLGQSVAQSPIDFTVEVKRVTVEEVIIDVKDVGKTRVVLMHDQPPLFGNLGSRIYCGSPSTIRLNVFAGPVGLRIGSEIALELAMRLRKGDKLLLRGHVHSVEVRIACVFQPHVIACIADWKVVRAAQAKRS